MLQREWLQKILRFGMVWHDTLLMTLGFIESKVDSNLCFKVEDGRPVMLLLCVDAIFSRHGGVVECLWNLPRTREVCSRDPREVQDHAYGIEPKAIEWCFIRSGWCYYVSWDDWVIDVADKHKTRYLLCCEHLEPVLDRSETCSLDCCKAYSKVPKGYNWLWDQVWGESEY